MPYQDGTGPLGQGAGTGRGQGPCGTGVRCGRFGGNRFRRFFSATNEKEALVQEEKALENELKAVRQAQKDLKNQK